MKQFTNIVLLSAGILLSLTGCQKGTGVENAGKNVRLSASTGYETRTAYSGARDDNKKIERIDWSAGDQIMVWSDTPLSGSRVPPTSRATTSWPYTASAPSPLPTKRASLPSMITWAAAWSIRTTTRAPRSGVSIPHRPSPPRR